MATNPNYRQILFEFLEDNLPGYYTSHEIDWLQEIDCRLDGEETGGAMYEQSDKKELKSEFVRLSTECFKEAMENYLNKNI